MGWGCEHPPLLESLLHPAILESWVAVTRELGRGCDHLPLMASLHHPARALQLSIVTKFTCHIFCSNVCSERNDTSYICLLLTLSFTVLSVQCMGVSIRLHEWTFGCTEKKFQMVTMPSNRQFWLWVYGFS